MAYLRVFAPQGSLRYRERCNDTDQGGNVDNVGKAAVAEFVGTFALIFFGAGAIIMTGGSDLVAIALAHGLAIAIMVSIMAHLSGGVFNPAIQIALWVTGKMPTGRSGVYIVSQLLGAVAAAFLLKYLLPTAQFDAVNGGIPAVATGFAIGKAVVLEAVLTFFLVWAVFGTAVDDRGAFAKTAGFTIGLVITIDIFVGASVHGRRDEPGQVVRSGPRHQRLGELVGLDRRTDRRRHHRGRGVLVPLPARPRARDAVGGRVPARIARPPRP